MRLHLSCVHACMHAESLCSNILLYNLQLQQQLAEIADRVEKGEFFYTRFFAIGMFRLLELTESRDPKALESLIKVAYPGTLLYNLACSCLCGFAPGLNPTSLPCVKEP
jgi:hypothetical protein